jgi:hypothetical protein
LDSAEYAKRGKEERASLPTSLSGPGDVKGNMDVRQAPLCEPPAGSKNLILNQSVPGEKVWYLVMHWTMLGSRGHDLNRPYPPPRKAEDGEWEWGFREVEEMRSWVSVAEDKDSSNLLALSW